MREILFRGKLKSNAQWAYGNLQVKKSRVSIITPDDTPIGEYGQVDPSTVGQYTGLTDKNGKRIFEGDIVRAILTRDEGCIESTRIEKGIIGYGTIGMLGLQVDRTGYGEPVWSDFFYELDMSGIILDYTFEFIGNIHDNPELLKEA